MLESLFVKLGSIIVTVGIAIGSFFGFNYEPPKDLSLAGVNPVQGVRYSLAGSGVTTGATSIVVKNFLLPDGTTQITMSMFGDTLYATLEPGTSRVENISCTGITQNHSTNQTATLTGCSRGLAFTFPYTSSSTLAFAHAGGATISLTNSGAFYSQFANKNNSQVITGGWEFETNATSSIACATSTEYCNKAYVDATVNQGAATSTRTNGGIVELATGAEAALGAALDANKPLALDTSISTSSCQVVQNSVLVSSSTTGKLDGNCFNGDYNYTFSGKNTFSTATTTFNATTSIAATANTSPLVLNGVSYGFPSTQAASSTVLTENGSGDLKWILPQVRLMASNFGIRGTESAGATTTYATLRIPANTLAAVTTIDVLALYDAGISTTCFTEVDVGTGSATSTALSIYERYSGASAAPAAFPLKINIVSTSTNSVLLSYTAVNTGVSGTSLSMDNRPFTISRTADIYIGFALRRSAGSNSCYFDGFRAELNQL